MSLFRHCQLNQGRHNRDRKDFRSDLLTLTIDTASAIARQRTQQSLALCHKQGPRLLLHLVDGLAVPQENALQETEVVDGGSCQ